MKPVVVKKYLTEALFRLLSKKPFEKISISDLVETAGVCRASFYRNYLNIDQIVQEYLKALFEEIYREHPLSSDRIRDGLCEIFTDLLNEKERLILLSRQGQLYRLPEYIYTSTINQIIQFDVLNNRYQPHFFAGASSAIISSWIANEMEETPEQMAELFIQCLYGYMRVEDQH